MAITSLNDNISRIGSKYTRTDPFWGRLVLNATSQFLTNTFLPMCRLGDFRVLPSLPAGVTAFIPQRVDTMAGSLTPATFLISKLINFGSVNIATSVFTPGSSMPSITEFGVSNATSSPIFAEVTTALGGTAGTLTVTYVDQDGNASEATTAQTMTNSAAINSLAVIELNSPDVGARSISAATQSGGASPTGIIKFWGIIPISFQQNFEGAASESLLGSAFNPVRLGAADQLGCFRLGSNVLKTIQGGAIFYVGE